MKNSKLEPIARVVHEALSAWRVANGQDPYQSWDLAPDWMRQSTIESVEHVLKNPDGPASTQHRQWMAQKKRDGWVFGPTRDDKRKIHPLLVPYSKLPRQERLKDALLIAIVKSLSGKR